MDKFSSSQASSSGQAGPMSQGGPGSELSEQGQEGLNSQLAQGPRGGLSESATPVLPLVDVFEDSAGVTIIADLPGVPKDRLGVRVEGDSLVIEGAASPPETGDMELLYGELLSLFYRRSFTLSRDLDPGKIEASLTNGVLKLNIPKVDAAKPRRIEVRVD
ncbi:MAG: Hsp20/alpha crystallin family protein [Rhodoferax sp.]|nr:Hsp20/alpha crystallin family protein [Rhodoferax sp.]